MNFLLSLAIKNRLSSLLLSNRSNRQIFFKNSFWRFAGIMPNKLIRFAIVLLAAKQLGPELFGAYNYLVAVVGAAFILSDWGINILLVRDYQQQEDKKRVVATSLVARIIVLSISVLAAIGILYKASDTGSLFASGFMVALTFFVGHIKELLLSIFLAVQKAELEAKTYLVDNILSIASFGLIFYLSPSVLNLSLAYFVASLFVMAFSWRLAGRHVAIDFKSFDKHYLINLMRNGLPLSLFGVLGYIFFSTDQLFIKHFLGYAEVGYYALASRIILTLIIVPSLLNSVLLPYLSQNIADRDRIARLLRRGLPALAGIGALLSLVIAFASPLAAAYFDPAYLPSVPILQWLSPILVFMFMVALLDHVLIAYNLQKQDFLLTLLAAIVNLVLNFKLVPAYGLLGAVFASIFSQLLNFILTFAYVAKVLKTKPAYA